MQERVNTVDDPCVIENHLCADKDAQLGKAANKTYQIDGPNGFRQTEYIYTDANGLPVFRVLRTDLPNGRKTFTQERWAVAGWAVGLDDTNRVLFNLRAVSMVSNHGIWLTEGEECAQRLIDLGLVATTTSGGASRTDFDETELTPLHGKDIYILPDNDRMGAKYVDTMRRELAPHAKVYVVSLPGLAEKEDVADWLDHGGTIPKLQVLARAARTAGPAKLESLQAPPQAEPDLNANKNRTTHYEPLPDETRTEDVRRALHQYWDHCDYKDWIDAGLALFRFPRGKEIWLEWSQLDERFNTKEAETKWRSFPRARARHG